MTNHKGIDEELVVSLYLNESYSTYEIADKLGTYPNKTYFAKKKRKI